MPHIFLSYDHEDSDLMARVRDDPRAAGFAVWTDENLTPGEQSWIDAIENAIRDAGCMVVLLSPDARKSKWVQRERRYADICHIQVIPVAARGSDIEIIPLDLAVTQWADLREDYTDGLQELILSLRKHLKMPEAAHTAPARRGKSHSNLSAMEVERLWTDLEDAEKREDWEAVITLGERILGLDANHAEARTRTAAAYNRRSIAQHTAGHYIEALADYSRAIELDPGNAEYYHSRGVTYHNAADAKHSAGDYAKAIADKTRAIELDPDNAKYYHSRGVSYHTAAYYKHLAGDYTKAIADHTRTIELDPDNAEYYYSRGVSYDEAADAKHSAGDYAKAIADKTRAIELDPDNAKYYHSRSVTYHNAAYDKHSAGDYAKALADDTRAVELDSDNAEYYYSRGFTYMLQGNREAARRDFQRAAAMGHEEAKRQLEALK